MHLILSYLVSIVIFVGLDMVWLSTMAPRYYRPILGDIALNGVALGPAAVFYLIYPIGLMIFAILPGLKSSSLSTAAMYGALFGFFTYATYDFTNQATLRNWSTSLSLIDVAWGTILAAVSATVTAALVLRYSPVR
jgi:uncharacterized membrane protein